MSKVTKADLNERLLLVETLLGLHRVLPEQISIDKANDAIFRMQWAVSRGKELAEPEPKLKVIDRSVFDHKYVTNHFYYVAINANGQSIFFSDKPKCDLELGIWYSTAGSTMPMLKGYDATDWQNSLIERKELTGKALVEAMLDNCSRKKVLVRVSSSADTKFEDWILTFAKKEGSKIVTNNSNTWDYMAAVDIEGEPLTAADVGL